MDKYDISLKIEEYRRSGQIDRAIEITKEAIKEYPESNFFYKILGDMSMVKKDYIAAGNAYIDFLIRIGGEIQYFKNFVKFWARLKNAAENKVLKQIYDRIAKIFNSDAFSAELKRNIITVLYNEFPNENEMFKTIDKDEKTVTGWIEKQEKAGNQWDIYRFLWWERNYGTHFKMSSQKDKKLIAIMEKYELYSLALEMTEEMLKYVTDEVMIRTLFRLCRKTGIMEKQIIISICIRR